MSRRYQSHKTASFAGLQPASETASRVKRANTRDDTAHELLLRAELWRLGLRFRKNVARLPGKPDIVFAGARVVVFCDGDFWHGRGWHRLRTKLQKGANASYWLEKIAQNIQRDSRANQLLRDEGWLVIRLWETDIKRHATIAAKRIRALLTARNSARVRGGKIKRLAF